MTDFYDDDYDIEDEYDEDDEEDEEAGDDTDDSGTGKVRPKIVGSGRIKSCGPGLLRHLFVLIVGSRWIPLDRAYYDIVLQ